MQQYYIITTLIQISSSFFFIYCFSFILMISLELWRARIGGWGRRIRSGTSQAVSSYVNEDRCLDLMTGISIYLLTICLSILLIIGGIKINQGPILEMRIQIVL